MPFVIIVHKCFTLIIDFNYFPLLCRLEYITHSFFLIHSKIYMDTFHRRLPVALTESLNFKKCLRIPKGLLEAVN